VLNSFLQVTTILDLDGRQAKYYSDRFSLTNMTGQWSSQLKAENAAASGLPKPPKSLPCSGILCPTSSTSSASSAVSTISVSTYLPDKFGAPIVTRTSTSPIGAATPTPAQTTGAGATPTNGGTKGSVSLAVFVVLSLTGAISLRTFG